MEKAPLYKRILVYVRWIGWVLLVQLILINISAALYAYKLTHIYEDPALRHAKSSQNIFVKTWRLFTGPRQPRSVITDAPSFPYDTVTLKTAKGISIDAWYSKADSAAKGTVILFHGITANKGMMLTEAAEFRYLGYNVLLVDFRGHGNSGGQTTTIGVREAEEVKIAYDYIASRGESSIFCWGTSMGAVAVARAIDLYALKFSGVMLEMPFGSLQSHLEGRARTLGFGGFPEKPFGFFVSFWMGVERGFNGLKLRTASYAKKISCPVLLQWGTADNYVQKWEVDQIYASIPSASKKMVVYEGAGHVSLLQFDTAKWRTETEAFLSAHSR